METFNVRSIYQAGEDREEAVDEVLGNIRFCGEYTDALYRDCGRDALTGLVMYTPDDAMHAVVFRSIAVGAEREAVRPTPIDDLPPRRQTLQANAKGVGLYTASSPEGVEVFSRPVGREIGVYLTPDVRDLSFIDWRKGSVNSPLTALRGILRHRAYQIDAKQNDRSELDVVRAIDGRHKGADVALMHPAPTVHAKHVLKNGFPKYAPVWALFRNDVELTRIGTSQRYDY